MKSFSWSLKTLEYVNGEIEGFKQLILYPGMEFRSTIKWWPDVGKRTTSHEGIDICYFINQKSDEIQVSTEFCVTPFIPGKIQAICKDYLGRTVFIENGGDENHLLISAYAHITPCHQVRVGKCVESAEVLGKLADTSGRKNRMPSHLHLTFMRVHKEVKPDEYNWSLICDSKKVELIDPLDCLENQRVVKPRHNHWKERYGLE